MLILVLDKYIIVAQDKWVLLFIFIKWALLFNRGNLTSNFAVETAQCLQYLYFSELLHCPYSYHIFQDMNSRFIYT